MTGETKESMLLNLFIINIEIEESFVQVISFKCLLYLDPRVSFASINKTKELDKDEKIKEAKLSNPIHSRS